MVGCQGVATRAVLVGLVATLGCQGTGDNASEDSDTDRPGMSEQQAKASCAALPTGTDEQSAAAHDRINMYRRAMGLPCIDFVPAIAAAAAAHCAYYTANQGSCIASPHREVATCDKFRGEHFYDRLHAAGYTGSPAYEDMTYVGNGAFAVDEWVDSIWHRIPILSPYVQDAGYGMNGACDTMDFGWAPAPSTTSPVVYPYDTQIGVPISFAGDTESPPPPRPPKGWPSGYPILIYAANLRVQSHTLLDDKGVALAHTFIAPGDATSDGVLLYELVMYADEPLKHNTTYRVAVDGTTQVETIHLAWSFTTR